MYVSNVHKFSTEFCNSILGKLNTCPKIYLLLDEQADITMKDGNIFKNQPSNADAWNVNHLPEVSEIQKLLSQKIPNVTEFECEVLRMDNTKLSKEHIDSWDYTSITLLNDSFDGGSLIVESIDSNLSIGDCVYFQSAYKHYVSPVFNGERFTLVCFMKTKTKDKVTLI